MLNQEFIQKMKIKLESEKRGVAAKIVELTHPEDMMDNPDEGDLVFDAADDILNESLLAVHGQIMEKIDMALEKIKKGSYGTCQQCGAPISEAVLEIEPWAEHCSVCGRNKTNLVED